MTQLYDNQMNILARKIEQKRQEMIDAAAVQGMESENTLAISQELDYLILAYQLRKGK